MHGFYFSVHSTVLISSPGASSEAVVVSLRRFTRFPADMSEEFAADLNPGLDIAVGTSLR